MKVILHWGYFELEAEDTADNMWLENFIDMELPILKNKELEVLFTDESDEQDHPIKDFDKDNSIVKNLIFGVGQF